jgi:uncharacterized repeat protein (TIGR03803 family)
VTLVKFNWVIKACGVFLLWAAVAVTLPSQTTTVAPKVTFTRLHTFTLNDGANPEAALVQATDGDLCGTTLIGGANIDAGTVFKITPRGTLTTLHSFNQTDGADPRAGLVQAADGKFYGTTSDGGANGYGTSFRISTSGILTTLYAFCIQFPSCTDGARPQAPLVQGGNGNFYGTAVFGGTGSHCGYYGCGTVFQITPSGTLTTLHFFDGRNGKWPAAGLVQGTNGDFYGTTYRGGANHDGTVFRITSSGILTTLHDFCSQSGCADGEQPVAGLVRATNGNLYGATYYGGASRACVHGCGTVFQITPSGTLTTLYSFCSQGGCADGRRPFAALVQGIDGNLYGTTSQGGAKRGVYSSGTAFKITQNGTLTTLYNFCSQSGCADPAKPVAALVQDTNGKFYGTTEYGGAKRNGTVFSLSVGLSPFVETRPTSSEAGAAVTILGTSLTGATSVTFNGTAATFTVVSASEITTTVPTGATSGTVQVVTPGGTLSSNLPFRVK